MFGFKAWGVGLVGVAGLCVLPLACSDSGEGEKDGQVEETSPGTQQSKLIQVPTNGGVVTIAGTSVAGATDAAIATNGTLNDPAGVAVAADGTTYIADWGNNSIRRIKADGSLDTFVNGKPNLLRNPRAEQSPSGPGVPQWSSTATWVPATSTDCPSCSTLFDGSRSFYYSATGGLKPDLCQDSDLLSAGARLQASLMYRGVASVTLRFMTAAGQQLPGPPTQFFLPTRTTWTNVARAVTLPPTAAKVQFCLFGTVQSAQFDSLQLRVEPTGSDRGLMGPTAVAVAPNGDLYIGDHAGVMRVNSAGTTFTRLTTGAPIASIALAQDGTGYFVDPTNVLLQVRSPTGILYKADIQALANGEALSLAVANGPTGHRLNGVFRGSVKVYPEDCPIPAAPVAGSTITCTYPGAATAGGTKGFANDLDGTAGGERFGYMNAIAVGRFGELLIADETNNAVRRNLVPLTETAAGSGVAGKQDGASNQAKFWSPGGMAATPDGSIIVADRMNNQIRKIICGGTNVCAASGNACTVTPTDDQNSCTTDTCMVLGVKHDNLANGATCTDGNGCTLSDTCSTGVCQAGTPKPVDDGLLCTIDSCSPATGTVSNTPKTFTDTNITDCLVPACNPATGTAMNVNALEGAACGAANSGRLCNNTGVCEATAPPTVVAPALPADGSSSFEDLTKHIYGGANPSQTSVVPGGPAPGAAINPVHAGWLVGYVKTPEGGGMANVTVTVISDTKFGKTTTRSDGRFDLIVNGGTNYTLRFTKVNHLQADRGTYVGWGETAAVEDVILIGLDQTPNAATTNNSGALQVSKGRQVTDSSGTRTATLMVPANTIITKGPPGAETTPVSSTVLRLTEYTEGPSGPKRMPAPLGPASAYTYAVEISADAAAAGESVKFSKDAYVYLENFLGFPLGSNVPSGFYDWEKRAWIPSKNGRVIKIVAVSPNVTVDVDGGGADDVTSASATDANKALGFTTAELAQLVSYGVGATLWRVPIDHLTPWDFNWAIEPPTCEGEVCPAPPSPLPQPDPCGSGPTKPGSIIHCDTQALGEETPIAGTSFKLSYNSYVMPGHAARRQLRVGITGAKVHTKLDSVEVTVGIAGQVITREVKAPFSANQEWLFDWDGTDAGGRTVVGSAIARITATSYYKGTAYLAPRGTARAFGAAPPGTGTSPIFSARAIVRLQGVSTSLLTGAFPTGSWLLGGWSLNQQHFYDAVTSTLYLGSGGFRKIAGAPILTRVFGDGTGQHGSANGNATAPGTGIFSGNDWSGVAVEPNGDILVADSSNHKIRRLRNGQVSTIAGNGTNSTAVGGCARPADGTAATSAALSFPTSVAVAPDGSIVVGNVGEHSILRLVRKVPDDGTYITLAVAGIGCQSGSAGDGGPAKNAWVNEPTSLAFGPEGALYIGDRLNRTIRRIDGSGIISTVAGNGQIIANPELNEGKLATDAAIGGPRAIAVAADGTVYFITRYELGRVNPLTGKLSYLNGFSSPQPFPLVEGAAMKTQSLDAGDGGSLALFPDGRLAFRDGAGTRLRVIETNGLVASVMKGAHAPWLSPADFSNPRVDGLVDPISIAPAPNGDLVVADGTFESVYKINVQSASSSVGLCSELTAAYLIPDGEVGYCFDFDGRHLRTLNLHTGAALVTFGHSSGFLRSVTTSDGVTNISLPTAAGSATTWEIVAPHLQKTTITAASGAFATKISDKIASLDPTPLSNGLLDKLTDRRGKLFDFDFDSATGRLTKDTSSLGAQNLSLQSLLAGRLVTFTTPLGRATKYQTSLLPSGDVIRTTTFPNLTTGVTTTAADGTTTISGPEGTLTTVRRSADPVWGAAALTSGTSVTSLPKGRAATPPTNLTTTNVSLVCKPTVSGTPPTTTQFSATAQNPASTLTCNANVPTDPLKNQPAPAAFTNPEHASLKRVSTSSGEALTTTSALGRTTTELRDAKGRVTSKQIGGLTPTVFKFDATTGQLTAISRGPLATALRKTEFEYRSDYGTDPLVPNDDAGFVKLVTDPSGQTEFTRDLFGRAKTIVEGKGVVGQEGTTSLGWDGNGNLTALTPPGRTGRGHSLAYNGVNLLEFFTPPTVTGVATPQTKFEADADRALKAETRQGDAQAIQRTYITSTGQLDKITYAGTPSFTVDNDYYLPSETDALSGQAPGKLKSIVGPYGTTKVSFKYNGNLPTDMSWSNVDGTEASGGVAWEYDSRLRRSKETVTSKTGATLAGYFSYDADNLLNCLSTADATCTATTDLKLTRSPNHGLVTDLDMNAATNPVKEHWDYSDSSADATANKAFGELRHQSLRYGTSPVVTLADIVYDTPSDPTDQRDPLGRIHTKTEAFNGSAAVDTEYGYDERGRLESVTKAGNLIETFGYDANGNRTSYLPSTGPGLIGTYDDQDRLLVYGTTVAGTAAGDLTFQYGTNGELKQKTVTGGTSWTYTYDALGNLLSAANSTTTKTYSYLVDGRGRRIGKKEKTGAAQPVLKNRWLYRDGLNPVAELDATGALVTQFIYGSRPNVPDLVIKRDPANGALTTYRLFSDQLGSPRMAVNVADPTKIPYRVDYSAFGVPTWKGTGTAATPAFDWIPFGFAGGLYDKDTGLLRFGARDYDPEIGRWVSKDPWRFRGGFNLYVYSWNDPVNFLDRTGRAPKGAGGASGTGEGGSEGAGGIPWTPSEPWPMQDRDWCGSDGSGWVPETDAFGSSNFQDACSTHDECYADCGSDQSDCDWNLGHDMQDQCLAQGDPCNVAGLTYSAAVSMFGGTAYNNAQADCVCGGQ